MNGSKLVYLDSAATSQKPAVVLDALRNYYEFYNSNVHRGIHYLSAKATDEFELARKKVARFINASDSKEIVFTRNATEAINLVAYSWGLLNLKPGDEVCPYFVNPSTFSFYVKCLSEILPNEIVNDASFSGYSNSGRTS